LQSRFTFANRIRQHPLHCLQISDLGADIRNMARGQTPRFRAGGIKEDCNMEPKKFTLCPACTACPEVQITDQGVEEANTVRLSHAEWNELVRLVKSGELREV
jgi:hypothetical protein